MLNSLKKLELVMQLFFFAEHATHPGSRQVDASGDEVEHGPSDGRDDRSRHLVSRLDLIRGFEKADLFRSCFRRVSMTECNDGGSGFGVLARVSRVNQVWHWSRYI